MRKAIFVVWLLVPVAAGAYHYGPGQERIKLDDASRMIRQADSYAANKQWDKAVAAYTEAQTVLPKDQLQLGRRLRLERAKAQMFAAQLPAANAELKGLVEELQTEAANAGSRGTPQLLADARSALANSQYYKTWLMRLEGLPQEQWEPEIEAARQTYKLLAQQTETAGDAKSSQRYKQDLESVIRLARMDLSELQGLPLPSQ